MSARRGGGSVIDSARERARQAAEEWLSGKMQVRDERDSLASALLQFVEPVERENRAKAEKIARILLQYDCMSREHAVAQENLGALRAELAKAKEERGAWRDRCQEAERDLAIAGVRGSPPPAMEGTIPRLRRELAEAKAGVETAREEAKNLGLILTWMLGESEGFPERGEGEGLYWWRKELRARIENTYEVIASRLTQEESGGEQGRGSGGG